MSPENLRIGKEARALVWPWLGFIAAAALRPFASTLHSSLLFSEFGVIGFYLAAPLIAAAAFGNEFQYRTMPLLLAQPVRRAQLWREKSAVMLAAAISVSLAYYLTWRPFFDRDIIQLFFASAFVMATIGSAAFWSLFARSTLGGLTLNIGVQAVLGAIWMSTAEAAVERHHVVTDAFPILTAGFAATVCYAAAMLWIGFRKFVRFEAAGDAVGQDLLTNLSVMPKSVARLFRWERAGTTVTLIRKELRLLRPVWLLALLVIVFLVCVAPLRLFAFAGRDSFLATAGVGGVGAFLLLGGILAGCLPMGEERQLGTHSWHLTLPVAVREQWLIKLILSLSAALVGGFLVIRSADFLLGAVFQKAFQSILNNSEPRLGILLFCMALLTFPAFWCAAAINGTVRAAALTVPVVAAFSAVSGTGIFAVERLQSIHSAIRDVVLYAHAFPISMPDQFGRLLFDTAAPVFLLGPVLLFAIFQSYRMFRTERAESIKAIVRPLGAICLVGFLCWLSTGLLMSLIGEVGFQESMAIREVGNAVGQLNLDPATLSPGRPQPIALADLSRVYDFSTISQRWLRNASITVHPNTSGQSLWFWKNGRWESMKVGVSIRFSNGSECTPYLLGVCKEGSFPIFGIQ